MGWTFIPKEHHSVREFFEKSWKRSDESPVHVSILDAAQVGFTEAYAAVEFLDGEGKREVFAATYMIRHVPNSYYSFGYKDMTEHSGPGIYNCPERIMRLLTPIPKPETKYCGAQWARDWRARTWKQIRRRKRTTASLKRLRAGDLVDFGTELCFMNGDRYRRLRVKKVHPLEFTDGAYSTYTIRTKTLQSLTITIVEETMNYPVFISPDGREHTCIGWAMDFGRTNWEWYAFEHIENDIYFGYVHGFESEFGNFSVEELKRTGIRFITDPAELETIAPPIGWTRKAA